PDCVSVLSTFFLQAEDGIRYRNVTGVQTCALPILSPNACDSCKPRIYRHAAAGLWPTCTTRGSAMSTKSAGRRLPCSPQVTDLRSEERRVGKEGRSRWSMRY